MRTSIVLTGAAGFIGSNVLLALNQRGITHVTCVDELGTDEKWKNLVGKQFDELLDKSQLFEWLEGNEIQAIIHLGACSSTVEKDASYLLENNYRYSRQLAEYALKRDIRFIYASSAATYGDGSLGFSDDHSLLEQFRPLNMYGYSKHLFDLWLKKEGYLDHVVGLKYFNVFGPNEFHKGRMCSAIIKMVPDVMKKGVISLFKSDEPDRFADGDQVRDFIYVKDAAQMTIQFLDNELSGIFNIGTGKEQTWNQLALGVIEGVDSQGRVEYIEMPDDLKGKYQNYTCADMHKSQMSHLYLPKFSLHEAVIDYVQNYVVSKSYV